MVKLIRMRLSQVTAQLPCRPARSTRTSTGLVGRYHVYNKGCFYVNLVPESGSWVLDPLPKNFALITHM